MPFNPPGKGFESSIWSVFISKSQRDCNLDTHRTLYGIKSTMHSHFFQSYFMNNSNFSSTFISFLSPCHNLFLLSRSVRCWTIVSADQLTCFCRLHSDLHRSSSFCSFCDDGKGSLRRLQKTSSRPWSRYLVLIRLSNANFVPEQAW